MFELTGALTYVLPTMLAVLVSKWIGDYFGKGSIYEGLIELNGYPFLDHQHQPVVSTTVDQNMTHADQLNVVTAHDETVASLSALLEETSYKGYPVVDNRANMTLLGYIGRNEIEYVLMSTRRIRMLPEDTPCLFASKSSGTTNRGENSIPPTPAVPKLHNPSFPSTSDASLPYLENNLQLKTNASVHHDETAGRVDFRPWVDQTPVTVQPKMSMDFVLDLFRDLGLRYVIIINNGRIGGLLTKKDMLSHVVLKHD
jgi:chloride channel 3/4/5